MISYLFSVLSLILLAPILYFIPTGFSNKGKLTVLTVSFLLASFGLFANGSLGLWKTVLILFIFIIFITYILSRRLETSLFEAEDAEEAIQPLETNELISAYQPLSYPVHTSIDRGKPNDDFDVSQSDEIADIERNGSLENKIDEIETNDSLENDLIDPSDFFEKEDSEGYQEDPVIEETILTLSEENEDLSLDESLLADNVEEKVEIFEKTDDQIVVDKAAMSKENIENEADYMAELEKIIMESELGQENPRDETIQTESHFEQEINPIEIPDVPEIEEIDLLNEEELLLNHNLEATEEIIPHNESHFENEEVQIEESRAAEEEHESILVQKEQKEQCNKEKEKLRHEMFQTMLSQIELARKMIDKNKYEQFVKDYMHPGLPLSVYYTFASFLIQHYLSHQEFEKLKSLLSDLEEKYVEYPILQQEIKFLQSHDFHK